MTRIALAIPHTPWVEARAESMARLREQLGPVECPYLELTERLPNAVWSERMWRWAVDTGAEWFLTLQDDVEVAPNFWPALDAMLSVLDGIGADVCGLSSVHPVQVEIARQGHRWYRTSSWLVGWAMAIRREALIEFLAWREEHPEMVSTHGCEADARDAGMIGTAGSGLTEDSLLNFWINATQRSTWHPVPTIVDHDTTIESSYGNDHHVHRRPWISWRDFASGAEGSLTDPAFWRPGGPPETVPLLPCPAPHHCWACQTRTAIVAAGPVRLCSFCVAQAAGLLMTRGGAG